MVELKRKTNYSLFPWGMHFTMAKYNWACITWQVWACFSKLSRSRAFFERNAKALWSGREYYFIFEVPFLSRLLLQECQVMETDWVSLWLQVPATLAAKTGQCIDTSWKPFSYEKQEDGVCCARDDCIIQCPIWDCITHSPTNQEAS